MRKLIAGAFCLFAGLVLSIFVLALSLSVRVGAGQSPASQNGDVNGDGTIDVSDAVYTLLFLFRNGEPPVACADSPELVAKVNELEQRLSALEGLPISLSVTDAAVATLAERFDNLGGIFTCFLSNANGRYRHAQEPANPSLFAMYFVVENNGADGPIAHSGGTFDGVHFRLLTPVPGHLLIRLRGRTPSPGVELGAFLDDVARYPRREFVSNLNRSTEFQWLAINVPVGEHELKFVGWAPPERVENSDEIAGFEASELFENCTLTVQFEPSPDQ